MCVTHVEQSSLEPPSVLYFSICWVNSYSISQNVDEGQGASGPCQVQGLLLEPWAQEQNPSPVPEEAERKLLPTPHPCSRERALLTRAPHTRHTDVQVSTLPHMGVLHIPVQ